MSAYHEKQQLWQCALHTLNNLFQEQWATREMLDDIATSLHRRDREQQIAGFFNPYKSAIPYFGYYDIGVLVAALETRDACLSEVNKACSECAVTTCADAVCLVCVCVCVSDAMSSISRLLPQ